MLSGTTTTEAQNHRQAAATEASIPIVATPISKVMIFSSSADLDQAADGLWPFMSLAGVEIKGLGRARLALGQVEHRLEYDEGQIEEQDRESPLSLLSRRYYLGAVEEAVAIKQHGSTICVPLAVLASGKRVHLVASSVGLFHDISKSLGPESRGRLIPAFSHHDISETKIEIPPEVRAHDAGEVVLGSTHSHRN